VRRALGAVLLALAACGTQEWSFDPDAGAVFSDAGTVNAAPEAEADGVAEASPAVQTDASGIDHLEGCSHDDDCQLASLHCDPTSGECVACVDDSQCTQPGLTRCDSALHTCVQCGVDGDCTPDVCESVTHQCVAPCLDGGGCPASAPTCSMPRALCVRCSGDADCVAASSGHMCDTASGQCVQCTSSAQCPSTTPLCNRSTDRCVQCLTSTDCGFEGLCDPTAHTCIHHL
jgi:hypothetical protein